MTGPSSNGEFGRLSVPVCLPDGGHQRASGQPRPRHRSPKPSNRTTAWNDHQTLWKPDFLTSIPNGDRKPLEEDVHWELDMSWAPPVPVRIMVVLLHKVFNDASLSTWKACWLVGIKIYQWSWYYGQMNGCNYCFILDCCILSLT